MLLALALKLSVTALVVVVACRMVERSGPLIGAMIATLPVSAGPAYAFLAMEHGPAFIAQSALASLTALAGTNIFVTLYAWRARRGARHGALAAVALALAGWLAVAVLLSVLALGLVAATLLNIGLFLVCSWITRDWRRAPLGPRRAASVWDVPIRAAAAMALVGVVLLAGRVLGPLAAGVAALAPVVTTSLAILLYPRLGGAGAGAVLANMLPGMLGNSVAVVALCLTAVPLGSTLALLLGLLICVVWNGGITLWKIGGRRRP